MARRIQPIFDAILADDRLSYGERTFVESLQAHYHRRKSLTAGRRRCLLEIEERLASIPEVLIDEKLDQELVELGTRALDAKDQWASDFVASMRGQLLRGRELTIRQKEVMKDIKGRHSPEAVAERASWASNFTPEMRQRLKIAARYYLANPPYFNALARKVLEDDTFVPTKRQYQKVAENKYATKVIESTLSEPKFAPGSCVALRSSAPRSRIRLPRDAKNAGVVLKADAKPVTSAARGSKVYSVLFFGDASPKFVEERWIKKARK